MTIETDWIIVGVPTGLCILGKLVARGIIESVDPSRICHNVPLGPLRVLVSLKEVFDGSIEWGHMDSLVDMVGSFLVWERCQLQKFPTTEPNIEARVQEAVIEERTECSNAISSNLHLDKNGLDISGNEVQIHSTSLWLGMVVKVLDEANFTFAIARIMAVNPQVTLGETTLKDTHVGILIEEFIQGAIEDHLKHRDCLRAWPLNRLVTSNGKLLASFYVDNAGELDASSQKRSYIPINRKRKQPCASMSKKCKSLSDEDLGEV